MTARPRSNGRKPRVDIPQEAIANFCRRHAIRKLALFGSVLRDDFRPDSDVDVLVEFEPGHVPGLAFFAMQDELSELLKRKVELHTRAFLSPYFRREVERSANVCFPRDDLVRLHHMLDAARKARQFVQGRERFDLETDEMLSLAVVRLLEIVGEAAAHVTEPVQAILPGIPWRQITGARNRLIHGYFDVDLDIIWAILQNDLPPLWCRKTVTDPYGRK